MPSAQPTPAKELAYYSDPRQELLRFVDANEVPYGSALLNVGCAGGMDAAHLRAMGVKTLHGIEPVDQAASLAMERYDRVAVSTLENWIWDGTYYDTVVFADVLEHLADPAAALRRARDWLADSGHLFISIPNVRHLSVIVPLVFAGEWRYEDAGIMDSTHLRFFTLKSFDRLLMETGWERIAVQRYGMQRAARVASRLFPPAGSFLLSRIFLVARKAVGA